MYFLGGRIFGQSKCCSESVTLSFYDRLSAITAPTNIRVEIHRIIFPIPVAVNKLCSSFLDPVFHFTSGIFFSFVVSNIPTTKGTCWTIRYNWSDKACCRRQCNANQGLWPSSENCPVSNRSNTLKQTTRVACFVQYGSWIVQVLLMSSTFYN